MSDPAPTSPGAPKFRVVLADIEDPRLLADVLGALDVHVIQTNDDGTLEVVSKWFDALPDRNAVYAEAGRLREHLQRVAAFDAAYRLGCRITAVRERRDDGQPTTTYFATLTGVLGMTAVGSVAATVSAASPEEQQRIEEERRRAEEERREREYQEARERVITHLLAGLKDSRAVQVQKLLHGTLNADAMWKIFELIRDDRGGPLKGLASKRDISRFTGSLNHPQVFGAGARHAVPDGAPPSDPMSLDEAQAFIRTLAMQWLEYRARNGP